MAILINMRPKVFNLIFIKSITDNRIVNLEVSNIITTKTFLNKSNICADQFF